MNPFLALILLSLVDSLFVGFRAAAGRNPLLHKTDYYLKSSWLGLLVGIVPVLVLLGFFCAALLSSAEPERLLSGFEISAAFLVHVYGTFATLVLAALLFWTYPHRKIREISVMLILGPFTLLRPYWIAGGVLWGAAAAPEPIVAIGVLLAGLGQGAAEVFTNLLQKSAQDRRLASWSQKR